MRSCDWVYAVYYKISNQASILLTLTSKKVGIPDIYHEDIQLKSLTWC